ncbi:DUF1294 domain-containing protein [Brevundimonas sp. GCM10030266]|uniref:DUF1294 domain-containing protein n=1 Tax=Brevundimonas sp. GCM10030266 TaxID=3273386 RepID=UPI00361B5F6B
MDGLTRVDQALIVLAVLQVAVFGLFGFDKTQARNGDWRVRERTLLLAALFGGIGAWFAQHLLRHKTRKEPFRTLLGAAVAVHLIAVAAGVWWVLN